MRTLLILASLGLSVAAAPAAACMPVPVSSEQLRGADVIATGQFEKVIRSPRHSGVQGVTAYRFKADRLLRDQTRLGVTLPVENVFLEWEEGCFTGRAPPRLGEPVIVYLRLNRQDRTWFDVVDYRYAEAD